MTTTSKELNQVWAKYAPTTTKGKDKPLEARVTLECTCYAAIKANQFKVLRKGKKCNVDRHHPPLSPRLPKKEPIWCSVDELPAELEGTIYCSGCDNSFYAEIHSKGRQHRKTGYGHYHTYDSWNMTEAEYNEALDEFKRKHKEWRDANLVQVNVTPKDLPSQQAQPKLDAKPKNVVWSGMVKGKPLTFTARNLKDFAIRRTVKRTLNRDWDLYKRQTEGVDILDDIATNAVVKFLERNAKGGIRNPYTYLSRCIDTAITDYRTERREQRLTVVPIDVLDWLEHNVDSEPELRSAALDIDYHEAIKARPKTAIEVHTVIELFKSKGIQLSPSKVRAVANALSGKNKGLHGNASTRRHIRSVLKALRDTEDEALQTIYTTLTGTELPRANYKVVERLEATLEEDLEPEMPVTRWVIVDGKKVYK